MKKTNIMTLAMASCVFLASCTSSYQAAGGLAGAMIGSEVGGAIGWLSGGGGHHGHYRGDNAALGSLIGMGVGALLGVGIASAIEEDEKQQAEAYRNNQNHYDYYQNTPSTSSGSITYNNNSNGNYNYNNNNNSNYNNGGNYNHNNGSGYYGDQDYQIGGGGYNGYGNYGDGVVYSKSSKTPTSTSSSVITISELTYTDADGDGRIIKGETIEVEGFITNTSNSVLYDVTIGIVLDNDKDFNTSPSLTTNLQPGQKIRYTGRIYCKKARSEQSVGINLKTTYNGKSTSSSTLFVSTK